MALLEGIGQKLAERSVHKERVRALKTHKVGTAAETNTHKFVTKAKRLFGDPDIEPTTQPAKTTRWVLESLARGGKVAVKGEERIIQGYDYKDPTGSTEHAPGIAEEVQGHNMQCDDIIAKHIESQNKIRTSRGQKPLTPTEMAAISARERPRLLQQITEKYITDLQETRGEGEALARRKLEVIQHHIIENLLNGNRALGVDRPAAVPPPPARKDINNPTPAELAAEAPHDKYLADLAIFEGNKALLTNADKVFEQQAIEKHLKRYRRRWGIIPSLIGAIITTNVDFLKSSTPTGGQQYR